jgi:molybdate transport system substrate-binding protein
MKSMTRWLALALLGLLLGGPVVLAAEVRVAVTANFHGTLQRLAAVYRAQTGHTLLLSPGASGALYAQIVNGAPFDLFFSADSLRPELLAQHGHGVADSRTTYAVGLPVLWSARPGLVDADGAVLRGDGFRFLAIAEPRNAPYGVAAQQILSHAGVWEALVADGKLVRAQNTAQAYQQIASGAADLGFVALAQVRGADGQVPGSYWLPPSDVHDPIVQQAIILSRSANLAVARDFMAWLRGSEAGRLIEADGYALQP